MKVKYVFALFVVALATQKINASLVEQNPLDSTLKNVLVYALKFVNSGLKKAENYSNNYFLDKLQNYTGIQEWSVNIQAEVGVGITNLAITVFEAFKLYLQVTSPNPLENKILNCISKQEPTILAAMNNATRTNGWCNNRLAANLTIAFQETTDALLNVNDEFGQLAKDLESCSKTDDVCVKNYAAKVTDVIKKQATGDKGTVIKGLEDVKAIYKIMFGQDVPACNKKYLFPILAEGFRTATAAVTKCIL